MKRILSLVAVGLLLAAVLFVANTVATPAPTAHAAALPGHGGSGCTATEATLLVGYFLAPPGDEVFMCMIPTYPTSWSNLYQICTGTNVTAIVTPSNYNGDAAIPIATNTCVSFPNVSQYGGIAATITLTVV